MSTKEPKPRSERAFQWDQWMATHQILCWLIAAALAVIGAVIIVWLAPASVGTYATIALAILLMLAYRWAANAPIRSMQEWVRRLRAKEPTRDDNQAYLDYLLRLEEKLPAMQKKELAFLITLNKGYRLACLDRKEEALALLRSFDQIWDPAMQDRINELIRLINGETGPTPSETKEQP